jgi:hypothetical protein
VIYRLLADLVVVVHAAYVAFIVLGLVAIVYGIARRRAWARNFYFRWLHLLMIAVVVLEAWLGITCPLTDWEHYLRERAGQSAYQGDFIAHWVHEVLFFELPTWAFVAAYTLFGAIVLATFVVAPPRRLRSTGNSASD